MGELWRDKEIELMLMGAKTYQRVTSFILGT